MVRDGNKLRVSLKGIESVTELTDANTIVNVSSNYALWLPLGQTCKSCLFFSDDVCWRHCLQEDKQTHVNVYTLYNKDESSKYLSLY